MGKVCIGIDLGGTFIKLAAMDEDQKTFGFEQVPTPPAGGLAVAEAMVQGAQAVLRNAGIRPEDVAGVGIGSPGPLHRDKGVIVASPNIKGFENFPLRDMVAGGLNLPTVLENDANAAAYGEFLCGAGREVNSLVLLTLGTGVGGGIVINGKVWHGEHDFAAEIGHMIVRPDGLPCGCGQHGCLEQYASAAFLARRAVQAIHAGRPSALADTLESKGSLDAAERQRRPQGRRRPGGGDLERRRVSFGGGVRQPPADHGLRPDRPGRRPDQGRRRPDGAGGQVLRRVGLEALTANEPPGHR